MTGTDGVIRGLVLGRNEVFSSRADSQQRQNGVVLYDYSLTWVFGLWCLCRSLTLLLLGELQGILPSLSVYTEYISK